MPKLSQNQEGSLVALREACSLGVAYVSKAVWKKTCQDGVSVHPTAMVKTGAVVAIKAAVSTNGKIIELYAPAP